MTESSRGQRRGRERSKVCFVQHTTTHSSSNNNTCAFQGQVAEQEGSGAGGARESAGFSMPADAGDQQPPPFCCPSWDALHVLPLLRGRRRAWGAVLQAAWEDYYHGMVHRGERDKREGIQLEKNVRLGQRWRRN